MFPGRYMFTFKHICIVWWLRSSCASTGNMGLCGAIPSGLRVLQKTGGTNTAPAMYLNNKPCSVSADTQIQSSGSREGSSQVVFSRIILVDHIDIQRLSYVLFRRFCNMSASLASIHDSRWSFHGRSQGAILPSLEGGLQGGASSNLGAIIGGVVGGIVGLAAIAALVAFFVLRNRRRKRAAGGSSGLKNQWQSMPGDEKVHTNCIVRHTDHIHTDKPVLSEQCLLAALSACPSML